MTYYKQHNISPSLARKPLITDTVSVNRRIHFSQIAQVLNIPIEEIRTLNPQFRADVIPGDNHPYMLVLPSQQVYSYIMSEDSIDNYHDDLYAHRAIVEPGGETPTTEEYLSGMTAGGEMRTINHKVGRGETLSNIASKYGMTTDELMALNGMSSERVRRGDNLKVKAPVHNNASADNEEMVPMVSSNDVAEDVTEDLAMNEQEQFDEVKNIERQAASKAPYKGSYTANSSRESTSKKPAAKTDDQSTRQRASRSNKSDWHDRNDKYNKDRNNHKSGSKGESANNSRSKSSKSSKKSSKPQQPTEVTVQKGESLTKIAEKAGVSVKDLERANGIDDGNKIKAGEKIKIPTKEEARKAKAEDNKKSGKSSGKSSTTEKSSKSSSKKSGSSSKSSTSKSSSSSKSSKSGSSGSSSKSSKNSKKK